MDNSTDPKQEFVPKESVNTSSLNVISSNVAEDGDIHDTSND